MEALGRLFDVGTGIVPVDLNTAGATGKRTSLRGCGGVTIVGVVGAAGSGTEDLVLTLKQHTAYTGGTSSNLTVVDHYYLKAETALDNDEAWTKVTLSNQTITIAGATYATQQLIFAVEIDANLLSDTYTHVSLDAADPGSVARLAAVLYLPHDLAVQRTPANLGNLLRPGAANA
jgi:hypothetical protein